MGNPRTIKKRRHKLLAKVESNTHKSVAPINAHELATPTLCSNVYKSQERPHAKRAGNGQLSSFMGE